MALRCYQLCLKSWYYGTSDFQNTSHYSSVGTGYGLDGRGSIPGEGQRFSLNVQTHLASYTKGKVIPFPGVNRPGREAAKSSPSSAEAKNGISLPPLPYMHSWCGVYLITHRDKWTFLFSSWDIKQFFCWSCFCELYLQWGTKKEIAGKVSESSFIHTNNIYGETKYKFVTKNY
jgi:hypothetical protein